MLNRLFVYGSLAPGASQEHYLAPLKGRWSRGKVRGFFFPEVGLVQGVPYPGVVLDQEGDEVPGFMLESPQLEDHWPILDRYEGSEYRRVVTTVTLEDGRELESIIYEYLRS